MTPYFGTIALAFVGPPTIKVQLLPYNRVRLMQVPVVQVCCAAHASLRMCAVQASPLYCQQLFERGLEQILSC